MGTPKEIDDYIKESMLKLRSSQEACERLQDPCLYLHSSLKEKDQAIERARAESSMNAQALRKCVEEDQKLAAECANLFYTCTRWENECSLYDHDRQLFMNFGNEAEEPAKEAETQVLGRVTEEFQFQKHQHQNEMHSGRRVVLSHQFVHTN